jgi:hypothetical protein
MDALSFDCQRAINLYTIISETGTSKEPTSLRGCAGLSLFATAGDGPHRGSITAANGRGFTVSGTGFYEIATDGTATLRGSLSTSQVAVSMAENNGGQIMIVDGSAGYIFTMGTNNFAAISDPDFPNGDTVTFIDGYFVVNEPDTQKYYISAINDGTSWDALDFGTASNDPDNLVAVIASNGNLWLLGESSIEAHANTGDADFPFSRISGAVIQTGCAAAATVRKFDNSIAWLGQDEQGRGVVWRAEGYSAKRLSTQAIEKRIAEVSDLSDAYAWVYHEQGHVFYALQIDGLNTTLVYDGSTGLWHERAYTNALTGEYERHLGATTFFFNQKVLVGSRADGKVYEMSHSYYSDAGQEMVRERITPHIQDEKRLVPHSSLELDMEVGVGLASGQGSDPQIMMQYSDDGGRTWSAEMWRTIGAIGRYKTRVRWMRLGMARDRVYKFRISDPVEVQINGAYLNAT